MDLLYLVLELSAIGFVVWLLTTKIPMPNEFKIAIYVVAVIALILFLLRRFSGSVPNVLP